VTSRFDTFQDLLERMGNPHKRLPPVIHVAGTNGKGSTVAFMRAILEEAGLRVHTYTSPHLICETERIRLAGTPVHKELLRKTMEALPERQSFFADYTATAFQLFSEHPADVCLVEVGVGGRLDPTNVVTPVVSVITRLGFDHQDKLGPTLTHIAHEKAGILKKGISAVTVSQNPEVMRVLESVCPQIHVARPAEYTLSLTGEHQKENAGLAIAAVKCFMAIDEGTIKQGLQKAVWPGRLQRLQIKGRDFILDSAHNIDGFKTLFKSAFLPSVLLLAIHKRRDYKPILDYCKEKAEEFIFVPVEDCHVPEELAGYMADYNSYVLNHWQDVFSRTQKSIMACGSIYLIGEILKDIAYEYS
jgi:dihydrofolate synthase/folylpolyglutamate synthase